MGFLDGLKKAFSEAAASASSDELTPDNYQGQERSYHYTDVAVYVVWQYGGRYGTSCASAGMRRGQPVELIPQRYDSDRDAVVIQWNGNIVATMRSNRMRDMVKSWKQEGLPVLAKIGAVGGEEKLQLEVAFYGRPQKSHAPVNTKPYKMYLTPELALLCERQFVAFDLETTGLRSTEDRIVEIAAVRFVDGKPTETFSSLVNCGVSIPSQVSSVNHITTEMLADAPDEAAAMKAFTEFIGTDCLKGKVPLVAHNAAFDSGFLSAAYKRCAIAGRMKFCDMLTLSQTRLPALEDHKLGTVAAALSVPQQEAHRAGDDARVCGQIMAALLHDWLDAERAKLAALPPEEQGVCRWVCAALKKERCDTEYLSFTASTYLSVNCWHRVLRFKVRAKTPYVLVSRSAAIPEGIASAPATKSEGEDLLRVYFASLDDLDWLRPHLAAAYKQTASETAAAWKERKQRDEIQAVLDAQIRVI